MSQLSTLTAPVLTLSGIFAISIIAFLFSLNGTNSSPVKNGLNLFGCLFLPEAESIILVIVLFLTYEKAPAIGYLVPTVFIICNIICMVISTNKNTMRKIATMVSCGICCLIMMSCTITLFGISCQQAILSQVEESSSADDGGDIYQAQITILSYDDSVASENAIAGIKSAAEEIGIVDSLVFKNANTDPTTMHNMCDELDASGEQYIVIIPHHKKGIPKKSAKVILYDEVSDPAEIGYETLMNLALE